MADFIVVTRDRNREVLRLSSADWRGTGDWNIRIGLKWIEHVWCGWGFLAIEIRKFTPGVQHHGDLLWRGANGERDGESDVVAEGEFVVGGCSEERDLIGCDAFYERYESKS